jgi:hypothetical protein
VLVVNMIPKAMSFEDHQDSEPMLAVNPVNPLQIAGSAFTPDPGGGDLAPIYVSTDGGNTWVLNSIVPSASPDSDTADITVAFGASSTLYAGIIRRPIVNDRTRLNILSTKDFVGVKKMKVLVDRTGEGVDQPFVQALTVAVGGGNGKDRVFVGSNDFNAPGGRTATVDLSTNAAAAKPAFKTVRVEGRATSGQDGPSVRPAIHGDGTVYAVLHAWRTFDPATGSRTADIVVVRDDNAGASRFTDLSDPGDGGAGVRVVQNSKFNFDDFLGAERTGGAVSIGVDPTNSSVVYVAWADDQPAGYTIHLRRSTDRGQTWSSNDLRTIAKATNPALAVNSSGKVAFLYQQLAGIGSAQRWRTHVQRSSDGLNWQDTLLADVPANSPPKQFDPFIGDYCHVLAVRNDFYGIFSANNLPDRANFPNGVVYQRNHDFGTKSLFDVDGHTPVAVSIDPFFFKLTE